MICIYSTKFNILAPKNIATQNNYGKFTFYINTILYI